MGRVARVGARPGPKAPARRDAPRGWHRLRRTPRQRRIEPAVGVLNLGELEALTVGELLGVLPQRVADDLQPAGELVLAGAAGPVPHLATNLIQRYGRQLGDVKRGRRSAPLGEPLGDRSAIQLAMSHDTNSTCLRRASPS